MLKYLLFDLDGTLLPIDMRAFMKLYFGGLSAYAVSDGYPDAADFIDGIKEGTAAMVKNDGRRTNRDVFWDYFIGRFGDLARHSEDRFEEFYREGFDAAAAACARNPSVPQALASLREEGYRLILATNPLFPPIATEKRIRWAGLEPNMFCHVTTYENSHYAKPNPAYYSEILETVGASPEQCLMIGNDCVEDIAAEEAGIPVFLLTDGLLNGDGFDLTSVPHGDLSALLAYLKSRR